MLRRDLGQSWLFPWAANTQINHLFLHQHLSLKYWLLKEQAAKLEFGIIMAMNQLSSNLFDFNFSVLHFLDL